MSIGPIDKFLSVQQLFTMNPAANKTVLTNGVVNGSLHPVIDGAGNQFFRGREVYAYLVATGVLVADPLGNTPDAFVYR